MVDGAARLLCVSPRLRFCRSGSHGSYRMAALFRDLTMKTSVFLLMLCFCRPAQCDPNPAEELQVETLVSKTSAPPPVTAGRNAAAVNTIATDASDDSELFCPKGATRNLLGTFNDGRLAANPLHGKTEMKECLDCFLFSPPPGCKKLERSPPCVPFFFFFLPGCAAKGCLCGTLWSVRARHKSARLLSSWCWSVCVRGSFRGRAVDCSYQYFYLPCEKIASVSCGERGAVQHVSSHSGGAAPQFNQSSSPDWTMTHAHTLGG